MAHYVIGDVQGCFQELQLLLNQISFNPQQDKLWFVGDLVNRGPDSLGVLELVYQLQDNITIVLGNHDFHLLANYFGARHARADDTLEPILQSPRAQILCEWLMQQPLFHYDPKLNCAMVHAGVPWQWDWATAKTRSIEVQQVLQNPVTAKEWMQTLYGNTPIDWRDDYHQWDRLRYIVNAFTRMRFVDQNGALDFTSHHMLGQQQQHSLPWFEFPNRKLANIPLFFGHWASLNGQTHSENVIALDTGCVWGGRLTAYRIEDKTIFSVKSFNKENKNDF